MPSERRPWFTGRQVWPASSDRNAPAAEIAVNMRPGLDASRMIVCRHMPPAPGCQDGPVWWPRRPGSSCQVWPASVDRNRPASSTPA